MLNKLFVYILYLSIFSVIIGPSLRIPLGLPNTYLYLSDFFIIILTLLCLLKLKVLVDLIKKDLLSHYFFVFIFIAFISLLFTKLPLLGVEKFISFLYQIRLVTYFVMYISVRYLLQVKKINKNNILNLLLSTGLIISLLGWLQYFLYPDLRNLFYLEWDPHFKRIFSTYLDPNFLGLILILTLILNLYLKNPKTIKTLKSIILFLTLAFTYSRSSYLTFIVSIIYFTKRINKIFFLPIIILLFVLSLLFLPRPGGEGVKLERVFTVEQRIDNWKFGYKLFRENILLGVGFNTLRYAKKYYQMPEIYWKTNNAGAGLENSFLFVAATTGIIGLIAFILLIYKLFHLGGYLTKITLLAISIHSFFLNSFFLPWIMMWLWIVVALDREDYSIRV